MYMYKHMHMYIVLTCMYNSKSTFVHVNVHFTLVILLYMYVSHFLTFRLRPAELRSRHWMVRQSRETLTKKLVFIRVVVSRYDLQLDVKVGLLQHLVHVLDVLVLERDSAHREKTVPDVQRTTAVGDASFFDP